MGRNEQEIGFWLLIKKNFLIELSTEGATREVVSSFVIAGIQTNAQKSLGGIIIEKVQALVRD